MSIGTGDVLYTYVYLNPATMPSEIMLQWNDGSSWEHRAYWGADTLHFGNDGTPSRRYMGALPAPGKWVQLNVPAKLVNLEGSTVSGMGFALADGSATWDAAGRTMNSSGTSSSTVTVVTTNPVVSRLAGSSTVITFNRAGNTSSPLTVNYSVNGTAVNGQDYNLSPSGGISAVSIPAGASSANLAVVPLISSNVVGPLSIHLAIQSSTSYAVGAQATVDVTLNGNIVPSLVSAVPNGVTIKWLSSSGKQYQIAYKTSLTDSTWTPLTQVTATGSSGAWTDTGTAGTRQRFYVVAQMN